jgi:SAM-dependent methyltransferase
MPPQPPQGTSAPRRALRLLSHGFSRLVRNGRDTNEMAESLLRHLERQGKSLRRLEKENKRVHDELRSLKREVHERLLQYHLQLGRLVRAVDGDVSAAPQLSRRSVPMDVEPGEPLTWGAIGDAPPDPEEREWLLLDACPVCSGSERTVVSPWNKFLLLDKSPDAGSARYDYSVCHACGVLYAARRPVGGRYRFLLEHFGEVTAKRGGTAEISNRVLNPYPLSEADKDELRRLAARGVFVSDHTGLRSSEFLAPMLRDRMENSTHTDIIGALLAPRGARVLEVRSRAGTILDGLRKAWGADVFAMPIWESQQFLLREMYGITTSDLIDFEHFEIPFDGPFDLIITNHMFTHVLQPQAFFAALRRRLKPGGHIYLHNEPDDVEFLAGKQSMIATLNPLHLQAFDQASIVRGLAANGFETVFLKRRNLAHVLLARMLPEPPAFQPMGEREQRTRINAYQRAFDRAVLGMDESRRSRVAAEWPAIVERAVARGVAEYDERGIVRLVAR